MALSFSKLLAAAMIAAAPQAGEAGDGLKAWIEPVTDGNSVRFQGFVAAPQPMVVTYRLSIERISHGGRATTSQGGRVEITAPNEPTGLSTTSVNYGPGDSYEVTLIAEGPGGETVRAELSQARP